MGYLPEALRNYLLRLGWAHGDAEIIAPSRRSAGSTSTRSAARPAASTSPSSTTSTATTSARRTTPGWRRWSQPRLEAQLGRPLAAGARPPARGMAGLKARAKTLVELAANAALLSSPTGRSRGCQGRRPPRRRRRQRLAALAGRLAGLESWDAAGAGGRRRGPGRDARPSSSAAARSRCAPRSPAPPCRPPVFEVMQVLGREETLARSRTSRDAMAT
jgi:glutamyl-tRNA synthetase